MLDKIDDFSRRFDLETGLYFRGRYSKTGMLNKMFSVLAIAVGDQGPRKEVTSEANSSISDTSDYLIGVVSGKNSFSQETQKRAATSLAMLLGAVTSKQGKPWVYGYGARIAAEMLPALVNDHTIPYEVRLHLYEAVNTNRYGPMSLKAPGTRDELRSKDMVPFLDDITYSELAWEETSRARTIVNYGFLTNGEKATLFKEWNESKDGTIPEKYWDRLLPMVVVKNHNDIWSFNRFVNLEIKINGDNQIFYNRKHNIEIRSINLPGPGRQLNSYPPEISTALQEIVKRGGTIIIDNREGTFQRQ